MSGLLTEPNQRYLILMSMSSVLTTTGHFQGGVGLDLEAASKLGVYSSIHLGQFDLGRAIPELTSRLFVLGGQLLTVSTPAAVGRARKG